MTRDMAAIDISDVPELARLAQEVAEDGRSRVLRAHGTDLAVLTPVRPRATAHPVDEDVLMELARRRRQGLSVTDMTAGILRFYAKTPPPSPREEKEAFEQAVADQVMESMEG